jgi:hypothetical protein
VRMCDSFDFLINSEMERWVWRSEMMFQMQERVCCQQCFHGDVPRHGMIRDQGKELKTVARATRWVCGKIAQSVAQHIFV